MTRPLSAFLPAALLCATPVFAAPSAVEIVGRLHFPLLHFPIALLFGVALLEFVWRRGDQLQRRVFVAPLLLTAALSAVITVVAGLALANGENFDGAQADTFNLHRGLGIGTAVLSVLLVVLQKIGAGAYRPLLVIAVVAVTVVGHEGGELVHGAGYLTRARESDTTKATTTAVATVVTTAGTSAGTTVEGAADGATPPVENAPAARERHPEGPLVDTPNYVVHIKPIFDRSCVKCHGPEKRKSGLRLDQKRFAMKGGESGPTAIVPGDASKSLVFSSCALAPDEDGVMPPRGKLLALSEIELIKRWIDQGAAWPD